MKRTDAAVFILTHGRADDQKTYRTLKRSGYTGPIYLIIDDEDPQKDQYIANFGDSVIQFSKQRMLGKFDTMSSRPNFKSVVYARNAAYEIARGLGLRFILTCDDDLSSINIRPMKGITLQSLKINDFDSIFEIMCEIMESPSMGSLGFSHGAMYIGGANDKYLKGYHFDTYQIFMVDVQKPIIFNGLLNEDTHHTVEAGLNGKAAISTTLISMQSPARSSNSGGLQELYDQNSPYVRAFYTVMAYPGQFKLRIQRSNGEFDTARDKDGYHPMILEEKWKK